MKETKHKLKLQCRELYFKYRTVDEIVRETGVNKKTLTHWIYGRSKNDPKAWSVERAVEAQIFIRESGERNAKQAHGVVRLGFQIVQEAMVDIVKSKRKVSIPEASMITNMITQVAKLMSLAEGAPTEIVKTISEGEAIETKSRPVTMATIFETMQRDPFMKNAIPILKERESNGTGDPIIQGQEVEGSGLQERAGVHPEAGDSDDEFDVGIDESFDSGDFDN